VAAINARGVTLHSFFQLPFEPLISEGQLTAQRMRFNKEKMNIIRSLDLLVIDEISMVRADLLDAVDAVLRHFRRNNKPFGGVQLLMIGDLQQLSPVVKEEEWTLLQPHYDTFYFFSSKALRQTPFVSIELQHVFRQEDNTFIELLNKVRENRLDEAALQQLNQRYIPHFQPDEKEEYITLCTHNAQAQRINDLKLNDLSTPPVCFEAEVHENFPEYAYPTDFELILKEEAQVMFIKNDPDKQFYNGKIGKIVHIDKEDNKVYVQCPNEENMIEVVPLTWENVRYALDPKTDEIKSEIEGTFTQLPLKTAWAITIHKSQGLTFAKAIIDAEAAFAHGQIYVALSRCKTLEGLLLKTPIRRHGIINNNTVNGFTEAITENPPNEAQLTVARIAYQREQLQELFQFEGLLRKVQYIYKIINENSGAIPDFTQKLLQGIEMPLRTDIVEVGDKFRMQIERLLPAQPDVEQNQTLQERIQKAAHYLSDKINTILINVLVRIDLDIDNRVVKKQFSAAVQRLHEDTQSKYACLRACRTGFILADFLKTKAVSVIEKQEKKPDKVAAPAVVDEAELPNPVLFQTLRHWRRNKAEELSLPAYCVFKQKTLYELVTQLPQNLKELSKIKGIGQIKLHQFGEEIVSIIQEYCENYK
jgi:ATP-dependent exoDNAse (exonuclease V) alpha subunit